MTPLTLDRVLAHRARLNSEFPGAPIELPVIAALALSMLLLFVLFDSHRSVQPWMSASALSEHMVASASLFALIWFGAGAFMAIMTGVVAGRRQAHFDAWASQQGWSTEDWARIASSPEVPFDFTRLATRYLDATSPGWMFSSQEEEPELLSVFQKSPRWNRVALKNTRMPWGTWVLAPTLGALAALAVVRYGVWPAVAAALFVGALVLAAAFAIAYDRAVQALRAALAEHGISEDEDDLPPEEWARIQASTQVNRAWLTPIHAHLANMQPGWSLKPETPIWRQRMAHRPHSWVFG